jgi:hypothetical protein
VKDLANEREKPNGNVRSYPVIEITRITSEIVRKGGKNIILIIGRITGIDIQITAQQIDYYKKAVILSVDMVVLQRWTR